MYKRFNFSTSSIATICSVFLISGCSNLNNFSLSSLTPVSAPTIDSSDSCNQQVQAIVRNSSSGSAFNVGNELNDLFNQSMTTFIRGGDFDFSQWIKGRGEQHLNTLRQNGGMAKLMGQLNDTARSDAKSINILNQDIARLTQCRQQQGRSITNQKRSRRISNTEARNQLNTLQNRINRDNRYIAQLLGQSSERVSTYQDTLKKLGGSSTASSSYGAMTRYSTGSLNVRSRPSTSGAIIGKLSRGEMINLEQDEGSWLRINHRGQQAYVAASFTSQHPVTSSRPKQSRAKNSVQQVQNAQQNGERKNEELAELRKKIEDDLAILEETT